MASSRGVELFSPNNPDAPFFQIKIEDRIYDIEYNYIENLSVVRKTDDIGNFNFTIVNFMDLNLENKFEELFLAYTTTLPPISIRFGWSLGPKSKWYRGYLMNYNPEFLPGGYMRLGVSGQLLNSNDVEERVAAYKAKSGSELVAAIAEDMGWVIEEIDQSAPFTEERPFHISNVNTIDYIRDAVEPITTTPTNEPFKLYVETGNGGETHIWFVPVSKKIGVSKTFNFYINMGNYGPVLAWSPKYSGLTMAAFLDGANIDLDTNDLCIYGSEAKSAAKEGATLTVYGATSPDRMGPLLANKWYNDNIGSITASLTIVGDPSLVPLQLINVVPMDAAGEVHRFTGGTYMIKEIHDNLGADYQTEMELVMIGDADGSKTIPLVEAVTFKGKE